MFVHRAATRSAKFAETVSYHDLAGASAKLLTTGNLMHKNLSGVRYETNLELLVDNLTRPNCHIVRSKVVTTLQLADPSLSALAVCSSCKTRMLRRT
jgi:hypothetical protein